MTAAPRLESLRSLELVVTASCNLACGYCYQNAKQAKRMDRATAEAALDLLLASREPRVTLLFIGGEPLLELELLRHAVAYVESRRRPGQRVEYQTSTNGLLVDEEAAEFLAEHDVLTQLSHDGVAAAQDLRGKGTHARLDALLDRLRRDHPGFFRHRLRVQITVTGANLPYLARSFAHHLEKRVPYIRIRPGDGHDPLWSNDRIRELDAQFRGVHELSLRHYEWTGQVPFETFRKSREAERPLPYDRAMCGIGSGRTLTVDVDGSVGGCITLAASYQRFAAPELARQVASLGLGALGDPDLPRRLALFPQAVEAAEAFVRKQDKRSSLARCGECRFIDECFICPAALARDRDGGDGRRIPDFQCAFNLVSLGWRERFPVQGAGEDWLAGGSPRKGVLAALDGDRFQEVWT